MVRMNVKHGEKNTGGEFLYDCPSTSKITEIAQNVVLISNLQLKIQHLSSKLQPRLCHLHHRTHPEAAQLIRVLSEANSYASMDQVLHNRPLSAYVLKEHLQTLETEVMVHCELMGFPEADQLPQLFSDLKLFHEDTTQLWWAGKELIGDKQLCDYIGRNEKTKIVVRLKSTVSSRTCN